MTISTKFNPLGISGGGGTDAYIQDGLVLHLDGINNGNTPGVWKDLSPEGNDVIMTNEARVDKGYQLMGLDESTRNLGVSKKNVPIGLNNYTIEVVITQTIRERGGIVSFGSHDGQYRLTNCGWCCGWVHYAHDFPDLWELNKRLATTCISLPDGTQRRVNNVVKSSTTAPLCTADNPVWLGRISPPSYTNYGTGYLYSVRAYNRPLTPDELKHNYELDRARFDLP